jgi:hypothetical protein
MANKLIIVDYKKGIEHQGYAIFYNKELDKHIVKRLPISDDERKIILADMEISGTPPEGYSVLIKDKGAVIKRHFPKKRDNSNTSETDNSGGTFVDKIKPPSITVQRKKNKSKFEEVLSIDR